MVCLGNICRSPLAEGLLKSKVDPQAVLVDSAGTSGFHVDEAPDTRMIRTARKHKIDISGLRGRQFRVEDFRDFDFILAMDQSNLKNILALASTPEEEAKVSLILDQIYPGEEREVPDPYYGGDGGFENVYQMLDRATALIAEKLADGKKL